MSDYGIVKDPKMFIPERIGFFTVTAKTCSNCYHSLVRHRGPAFCQLDETWKERDDKCDNWRERKE